MSTSHYAGLLVGFLVDSSAFFEHLRLAEARKTPRVGDEVEVPVLGGTRTATVAKMSRNGHAVTVVRYADSPDVERRLNVAQQAGVTWTPPEEEWRTLDDRTTTDFYALRDSVAAAFDCDVDLVGTHYSHDRGFGLVGVTLSGAAWRRIRLAVRGGRAVEPASHDDDAYAGDADNSDGQCLDLEVAAATRVELAALRERLAAAGFGGLPRRPTVYAIPEEG